ncbi:putative quinol monooxygenase [Microbacterium sp. B2969]|uniref:Quinol monooxygenase n=1 Tax=Microbacterium alkaliflavum TaxID=3248839 RepID=A0ABW7QDY8_9MICO
MTSYATRSRRPRSPAQHDRCGRDHDRGRDGLTRRAPRGTGVTVRAAPLPHPQEPAMTQEIPVVLYARFTAQDGCADEVENLLRDLVANVRNEPGNIVFDAYREKDHDHRFFVFEVYRDLESFEAHLTAPYGGPFNRALRNLIVEHGSRLTFLNRTADGVRRRPRAGIPGHAPTLHAMG